MRQAAGRAQVLGMGVPNFFRSRALTPFGFAAETTSYYDTAPMRALIRKYVDFDGLRTSPVRLLVSAVNIETAELEIFDSYVDDLTPDHLLASGSLPPGFPWTMIDGKAYWDGGIISNSPLDLVVERCGPDGKRVFIVDLFAGQRDLPTNMMEVMARRSEIVYSERVRSDLRQREIVGGYRRLIDQIMASVPVSEHARIKRLPGYIQLMGDSAETSITRIVRQGSRGEHSSRDYDFSDIAIAANIAEGRAVAEAALAPAEPATAPAPAAVD